MDLTLYKNQLQKILKDLDKEIDNQFGKADETQMDMKDITAILGRIDTQIINRAQIAKGMAGDKATRDDIKQMIDEMNKEVKTRLDRFADSVSTDDKKHEIGGLYNKHVKNNATNKTQRQLDELESGNEKYERKDVADRLTDAEREYEKFKKIYEKSEKYEKLKNTKNSKHPKGLTDTELQSQFVEFQTHAQTWKDKLQKLEEVKKYDYQKNLEELASLANSGITVEKELVDKYKDFQKHLHFLSDQTVSTSLDGQDPAKMSLTDIRIKLATLQAMDIEKLPEIKDNADCVEATNEAFSRRMNGLDILNLFPEDKKRIKESLGDDSKPWADKWKDIEKFVKANRNVVKDLANTSKDKAKVDMLEARIKVGTLQEEQNREEQIAEKEEELSQKVEELSQIKEKLETEKPEEADTTKLDLTDLGLDSDVTVKKALGGSEYDFAELEGEYEVNDVVDELYDKIYSNPEAVKATKDYLRSNALVPATVKKGRGLWRVVDWFRKKLGRPTTEDRRMESYIKDELKKRVDGTKEIRAESDLEMQKYEEEVAEYYNEVNEYNNTLVPKFNELVALKDEDLERFNQAAAEVIVKNRGKAKPKDIMKEAEDKMYSDDLDR